MNRRGGVPPVGMSDFWSTSAQDIVVGVVGVTGSGKSSFIKRITQCEDIKVGDGVDSVTEEIAQYKFKHEGVNYTLIDTPGFDDSERDDEDIFRQLAKWTEKSFRAGQRLNGLLYLHPIISNRERGSEIRNLRMFKKLCGADNFTNVVLGLTFCDQELDDIISRRRRELVETPHWWGDMINKGSRIELVPLEPDACVRLLSQFCHNKKLTLKIQTELVHQGVALDATEAAQTIVHKQELDAIRSREKSELARMQAQHQKRMEKANEDYKKRMALIMQRYESIQKRQKIQEQTLLLQRQLHEQLERRERLLLAEQKAKEEEEAEELKKLADMIQQTKLENDRIEQRMKVQQEMTAFQPLLTKRYHTWQSDWTAVQEWTAAGHVKQKIKNYKFPNGSTDAVYRWFLGAFCDRCLRSFGPSEWYYMCTDCKDGDNAVCRKLLNSDATSLYIIVCGACKSKGKGCWDTTHENFMIKKGVNISGLENCRRYARKVWSVTCDKCKAKTGGVFVHCCGCSDDADLCLTCWGKGATCQNKEHDLHLVAQCPPDIAFQLKQVQSR